MMEALSDDLVDRLDRRFAAAGASEGLKPIGVARVIIGRGALERLAGEVRAVCDGGPVIMLEDATAMLRGGRDLKAGVEEALLASGLRLRRVVLGPPSGRVHAVETVREAAAKAVVGASAVVSVGSGTITDIAKDACHANGGMPLLAVQTAVSVNGFSDDMAVVVKDGVKRTVPSQWVTALVVDTDVIRSAPQALNQSGVGELLAMFTAPADWRLAALVGLDGSYSPAVVDLFRSYGEQLLRIGPAIGRRDGTALDDLAQIMTASGVALGVAGQTAPLSGMEHTVSHMLDMSAAPLGLDIGLHGAQVGVAALVAACLWERMLERFNPQSLVAGSSFPSAEQMAPRVLAAFSDLDPSGAMGAECWADYRLKLQAWHDAKPMLAGLADDWPAALTEVKPLLGDVEGMAAVLRDSGAPTRFSELDPPVDPARARWAVANCGLMRRRLTVADLASLTGYWTPDDVDAVLERAAELGGGL